ncbi:hypothetical protein RhiirA4_464070, partial [Rhizophagus irregularis]
VWVDGAYIEWDSKEQQLKRFGEQMVVLERLDNVENANHSSWFSWFEEAKSHLNISNKWNENLRKYLQQNHNQLTWKERIQIVTNVINALSKIHQENTIHRDLHSGNIIP